MALSPGARLGPYEIRSVLGAGGMGEVYRARDPRLGRDVAIKVLPAGLSADPDRLHRFEQEARAAAALSHPNIVAVYDIGTHDGSPYIVSELLDGETLRKRLQDGALPLRRAIDCAVPIAHGLGAAHDKGIVHRDLKPENVFVTADGRLKILDFGLAKLTQATVAAAGASVAQTAAPDTLSGMVLGTVGYMAPEQVRGAVADHRADIFAFGAILYEMLAGTRAFQGDSAPETMTAILKQDPPHLSTVQHHVPPALTRVVNRCLEKDPAGRFRSIEDVAFALEGLADAGPGSDARAAAPSGRRIKLTRSSALGAAAVLIVATTFFATQLLAPRDGSAARPVSRVELNLPGGTELNIQTSGAVALSPDGRTVAFVGTVSGSRQIYVRRLDQSETVALRGSETTQLCFFSPDGGSIGFISADRILKRVSLGDGLVVTVTHDADFNMSAVWTADGRIVFGRGSTLWEVPAAGGTPTQITMLDRSKRELLHGWPTAVDEGDGVILFTSITGSGRGASHIEALSLPSGERRVLVESGTYPLYAPGGHLIFFRDGALLAAPFDAQRLGITGPPVRVVDNVAVAALSSTPMVAISESGSLLYAPNDAGTSRLVWVRRDGAEEPLNNTGQLYRTPRFVPDGRSLVVQAGGDLWMQDTLRGTFTRLTSDSTAGNSFPVLTPDGARVVLRTLTGMLQMATDGSGRARPVPGSSTSADIPSSVSPDGRTLALVRQTAETSGDVYVVPLDGGGSPHALVSTPAYEGGPQFSPDGRWMAFTSDESGRMEVYVRPYPGPDRKWLVSTEGGTHPVWNRNGRELFYRIGNKMMAVSVSTGPEIGLSPPRRLFEQRYVFGQLSVANYDVSPDGQRFVMVKSESDSGRLNLVLNWFEELKRLAPPTGASR